jgi:hypothetical protein
MASLVITPEIEADARRLAEATGTTPTEAMANALRSQLHVIPVGRRQGKMSLSELQAILARVQDGPVDTALTDDEILGYDTDGIPEQPYLDR